MTEKNYIPNTKIVNITGIRFGRLEVISFSHTNFKGQSYWKCQCDCGKLKIIRSCSLRNGSTKSCGCLQREINISLRTKHNMCDLPEYKSWACMKQRCYNPNTTRYKNWGGRGITVCNRWLKSFENFLADMGYKPTPKHSIDRINNDGNYEPSNCRWATPKEQITNRLRKE